MQWNDDLQTEVSFTLLEDDENMDEAYNRNLAEQKEYESNEDDLENEIEQTLSMFPS